MVKHWHGFGLWGLFFLERLKIQRYAVPGKRLHLAPVEQGHWTRWSQEIPPSLWDQQDPKAMIVRPKHLFPSIRSEKQHSFWQVSGVQTPHINLLTQIPLINSSSYQPERATVLVRAHLPCHLQHFKTVSMGLGRTCLLDRMSFSTPSLSAVFLLIRKRGCPKSCQKLHRL